jgi:Na+/proline symporter
MGTNRRKPRCEGGHAWRSHCTDSRKSGFRYVLTQLVFAYLTLFSLEPILLKSKVPVAQENREVFLFTVMDDYFQNGCAALNFMVCREAILQTCLAANLQACSYFTWRMSRPAMLRPYRFSTNSSSLTECVFLYLCCILYVTLTNSERTGPWGGRTYNTSTCRAAHHV